MEGQGVGGALCRLTPSMPRSPNAPLLPNNRTSFSMASLFTLDGMQGVMLPA